ncbi:MAG: hypothetical protein GXX91_15895 [Verrucomicrobiaceae bacterium]|nr:hypothetical protein [Verrucomicrobiaceae bacterium]
MNSEHLEAYLAGELDEKGRGQVEHVLRHDSDLRASFVVQAQMEAALRVLLGGSAEKEKASFHEGVLARLRREGADDHRGFAKSVLTEILEEREGLRPLRWPLLIKTGLISAAASIGLLLLLQTIIFDGNGPGAAQTGAPHSAGGFAARIERSDNLHWAEGTAARIRDDGWLSAGLLEVESGTLLITFNSGATALVEGPAQISIESNNRMFLQSGRLTADVPPAATGFTVNTPRLNAVDLGTRFGVTVEENGDSELHVMEGEVKASRTSGNSVATLVREGLALRADSRTRSELQPVPYAGDHFTLRLGSPSIPQPALRYLFDETAGALVEDSGALPLFDARITAPGELDRSPRRGPGKKGGGLVFQPGEVIEVPLSRDFRLESPHTIAFWVKFPPKIGENEQEQILQYGREGLAWKVSCNLETGRGVRGALKVAGPEGHVIGSTDLADGNWHHVAYRFIGGDDSAITSHLQLFVDGTPETLSDSRSGAIPRGRVGHLRLGGGPREGFHGWIDELVIYREAISTPAMQHLLE